MANLVDKILPANAIRVGDVYRYRYRELDGDWPEEILTVMGRMIENGEVRPGPMFNDGQWDDYEWVAMSGQYKKIVIGKGELLWPT